MTDNQSKQQTLPIFSLIRLRTECKLPPVRVDFSAPFKPHGTDDSIIPIFNADRLFFTPCFLLFADQKYYEENRQFEKYQFEEKIQRSLGCDRESNGNELIQDLEQPIPHTDYCQICQQKFANYQDHISTTGHKNRATKNQTNELIAEICQLFAQDQKSSTSKPKRKPIRKIEKQPTPKSKPVKRKASVKMSEQKLDSSNKLANHSTALMDL